MALSTEEFASELSRQIRERGSFGGHPLHAARESVPASVRRAVDTSLALDGIERTVGREDADG